MSNLILLTALLMTPLSTVVVEPEAPQLARAIEARMFLEGLPRPSDVLPDLRYVPLRLDERKPLARTRTPVLAPRAPFRDVSCTHQTPARVWACY